MKHVVIYAIVTVLLSGCGSQSSPSQSVPTGGQEATAGSQEVEARKLYMKAAQLIKVSLSINNLSSAFNKRKEALVLLEKIPQDYPESSFALKIVEGDFKLHSISIVQLKESLLPPTISIHDAAEEGNILELRRHLSIGTDINKGNKINSTPLHRAIFYGKEEAITFLVDQGANVNAITDQQYTPLHSTVSMTGLNHGELNKRGFADQETLDDMWKHHRIARLLLSNGANVNTIGYEGKTPLDAAIQYGLKEISRLLRAEGGKTADELKAEGK
jgi:hypothetical protein